MTTINKKFATAAEIQAEIARRLERKGNCARWKVPMPEPVDRAFFFANWNVVRGGTPEGCSEVVADVIRGVMLDYDMKDGPTSA